ncbi:hypothetical protein IW147_001127 [Coemansia sp. RSA 720]|nr:hypothetical protein IW147_001127 [Coemansia sp. RSA 720]
MAPSVLTATVADIASATDGSAARHAMGISHLTADEVDATFSPLSSSTITITSLGSSLGFSTNGAKMGARKDLHSHALSKGADVLDSDSDDDKVSTGASPNKDSQDFRHSHLRSYSSANISTAAESSASSASYRSVSLDLPRVVMRSVSVDHTRAYGLHMLHSDVGASTGPAETASQAGSEVEKHDVTGDQPQPSEMATTETPRSESVVTGASKVHTSLAKRLLGPLTRKHGGSAGGSAGGAASNKRIVASEEQCLGADNANAPNSERKESMESATGSSNNASEATATPGPAVAAKVDSRVIRSNVPSKSLDISRPSGIMSRGPLNRRMLQRTKQEDAIYNSDSTSKNTQTMGPMRFHMLSRSLASRLGFSSLLADRRRAGDLRFVITPHAQLPEVVEVYDCDEMAPVYRKVSRSGKSWHETFHEVNAEAEEAAAMYYPSNGGVISDYEMASALGLPYPGLGLAMGYGSTAAASCVTFHSSTSSAVADNRRALAQTAGMGRAQARAAPDGIHVLDSPMALSNPSTVSFVNAGTVRMTRGVTMGASMYGASVPFDRGLLWEALTPFPNQFPLHIKDSRSVIDTVSLASMVLDRHNFCYRFQLGHNRMRWVAKRARKHQLALQCFVRTVLVAEVFVDYEKGYSPYNMPAPSRTHTASAAREFGGITSSSGGSTPVETVAYEYDNTMGATSSSDTACLPEDGSLPVVTILSAAFDQLAGFDEGIVESFIIFTGMQMLECLHI